MGHIPGSDALEKVVSATLRAAFPDVVTDHFNADNSLVMASSAPLSGGRMLALSRALAPELGGVAQTVASRLGPPLSGGSVFTDDRAPVEWLTDLSILGYAAGKR